MDRRRRTRILRHYQIERELAQRLAHASPTDRTNLYTELYDELFRRVPDHPQIAEQESPSLERRRMLGQARFLEPMLQADSVYLELGPGSCALARRIANKVERVYAVDVSRTIASSRTFPANLQFVLSDGTSVPVPTDSVDLAFSNQLMEHLHPEDAAEQLSNVYRALKPGGRYFCITPSRLSGPHDISQHFDDKATGFHLKEYTYTELETLFRAVGFKDFRALIGYRGWRWECSIQFVKSIEKFVDGLPRKLRRWLSRFPPIRLILGVKLIACK